MPLVFVHGVNNRRGETAAEQQAFDNRMALLAQQMRSTAFAERVKAPDGLQVFTPYWGDLGVSFARGLACLPQDSVQSFTDFAGGADGPLAGMASAHLDAQVLEEAELEDAPLLTIARTRSLGAAIDLLFAGAAHSPLPPGLLSQSEVDALLPEAARFAEAAERYAAAHPQPAWLSQVEDDEDFLNHLIAHVAAPAEGAGTQDAAPQVAFLNAGVASFGVGGGGIGAALRSWLDNAVEVVDNVVGAVAGAAVGAAGIVAVPAARGGFGWLSKFARPAASALIGRFFGDIFIYLESRHLIADRVLVDVDKAVAAKRQGDDELYLVGHSFGGIILYDILSKFRPELKCDLFVTVGSQVALLAEMGRLADKETIAAAFAQSGSSLVPRPASAKRWINIFDSTDLIGFGTRGVFAGTRDYRFETDALPILAHGAYFDTPRFYARLRERVREAFLAGTDTP